MNAKLYRMVVRRECEITGLGKIVKKQIVPAYYVCVNGKAFVSTLPRKV